MNVFDVEALIDIRTCTVVDPRRHVDGTIPYAYSSKKSGPAMHVTFRVVRHFHIVHHIGVMESPASILNFKLRIVMIVVAWRYCVERPYLVEH